MNNGQMQRVDSLMFAKNEAEFKLKDALSKIEEHRSTITSLNDKLTAEVKKYHNNVKQLEKLILQVIILLYSLVSSKIISPIMMIPVTD